MRKAIVVVIISALLLSGLPCHGIKAHAQTQAIDTTYTNYAGNLNQVAPTDENGFLTSGEDVYENESEGIWRYNSPSLRIEIFRRRDEEANLTWTETELFTNGDDVFHMVPNDADHWMTSKDKPEDIAQKYGVVFSVNSDFAHMRLEKYSKPGILIRNRVIFSDKTKHTNVSGFPNLDTLALYPDGDMQVFHSDEHSAQEYLDLGVTDVLAFGPYLIRNGVLNIEAIEKYGISRAPRTAIGMVDKGHYFAMMLEGRHSLSKGAGVSFLAEKLYEKGCMVAMNLDGGQSATMVFMGKQIITVGKAQANASARSTAEILGIGYSRTIQNKNQTE